MARNAIWASISNWRGVGQLAVAAVTGATQIVEEMHRTIVRAVPIVGKSAAGVVLIIPSVAYRSIRGVTRLVGAALDTVLAHAGSLDGSREAASSAEHDALRAVINGELGDYLISTASPLLEPGTTLLANDIPLDYYSDNSLTAAVNWAYAPNLDSFEVPYMLYFVSVRLGLGLPGLEPGLPIVQHYRPGAFEGSTSDVPVMEYEPPGCLQILDERLHDSMPGLSEGLSQAIPLSDLQRIDPSPQHPARSPFAGADGHLVYPV